MRPLSLLKCLGKALIRHAGNAVGFGLAGNLLVNVGEEVWYEWNRDKNEQERRAEVAALVQMAALEFRRQVAEVVREVAAGQPEPVRQRLSRWLEEVPDRLRRSADDSSLGIPPERPLRQAEDLVSLLMESTRSPAPADAPPPARELPPPARVTLTLTGGDDQGQEFVFEERTTCILGRQQDCQPRFPNDERHRTISRHHCLLDINPPDVCVRDLGSLGGTYVNGELLDKRPEGMDRDEALKHRFRERDLKDGDELRLCQHGAAVFHVRVSVPTLCATCGAWIPDDRKAGCEQAPGVFQCAVCRAKAAADAHPRPVRACVRCGRDVAGEAGASRPGEYVCATCRNDPGQLVPDVQGEVGAGEGDRTTIQGYTLLRELGRGGMGIVYLGRHERSGRPVAVKMMLPQVAASERAVQRFLHEMANTRVLNHPNVVRLGDTGYARGTFFLTLEYCDGGSVAGLMKERGGTLPLDEAVEITLQTLEGLHYAHNVFGPGKGLVHRDLKPANLFLAGSGSARVAKVGDYGLSKAFDDAGLSGATRTGEVLGTPAFMARQQVIDFKCSRSEVDVWAAVASLYAMLTGAVPRDFPKKLDPWLAILESAPVPIRRRQPAVPKGLADVIDRALVDDPEIPFKTAAAFKEALESAL